MVASPLLARALQNAISAFEKSSLSAAERETVILAMARAVGCDVCIALHHRMLAVSDPALADKLREGAPTGSERLDALVRFTVNALETRGDLDSATWTAFLSAGFTREQALEIMLGLGAYTMSMYANRLTAAVVDV
jgi:alkylhydroperoxidase family enzyme